MESNLLSICTTLLPQSQTATTGWVPLSYKCHRFCQTPFLSSNQSTDRRTPPWLYPLSHNVFSILLFLPAEAESAAVNALQLLGLMRSRQLITQNSSNIHCNVYTF